LPYLECANFQAVQLNYEKRFVATVILPTESADISVVSALQEVRKLSSSSWKEFSDQFKVQSVRLLMPRFKVNRQIDPLEKFVPKMGIQAALSPALAEFTEAFDSPIGIHLSQILHRTYVLVGESGTDEPGNSSLNQSSTDTPLVVYVNRTFLFVISDKETGALVFAGVVDDFEDNDKYIQEAESRLASRRSISRSRSRSPKKRSSRSPDRRRRSRSPDRKRSRSRSPDRRNSEKHYRRRSRSRSRSASRSRSPRRYRSPRRRSPPRYSSRRYSRSPSPVGRNEKTCIFVRNFPDDARKRDLEDLFAQCGSIRNIYIGVNKEHNAYAFVSYFDPLDAEDAMDRFKGYEFEGRKLCLDWDVGLENKRKRQFDRRPRY